MKRFIAFTLTAVLLLSFCGCGSQSSGEFDHIVQLLEQGDYDGAKAAIDRLQGSAVEEPAAISTAPVMEPVDEIPPMEIPEETEISAAPAVGTRKLLTKIPVTQIDNLGNESSSNHRSYSYDEMGRVIKICGQELAVPYGIYLHTFADYLKIEYDAEGKIANVKVTDSWDNVSALGTPTFDSNGNLTSMHIQTNTEEFTLNFSYDANGNCIFAQTYDTFGQENAHDIHYSYDGAGRLVQEVWNAVGFFNSGKTIDYTYDESGVLVQTDTAWHGGLHETTVYTYDSDGDLIQSVTTSDSEGCDYKTKTADYIFEYLPVAP